MRKWRSLLNARSGDGGGVLDAIAHESEAIGAYDSLVWNAWMPSVRRAALSWNPRLECAAMIDLIAQWMPILPTWIQDDLFDNIIIPRLRDAVEKWDCVSDEIPVDQWIVPWHEVLGDRLLIVYPHIRQKFARALRAWTATDLTQVFCFACNHNLLFSFLQCDRRPSTMAKSVQRRHNAGLFKRKYRAEARASASLDEYESDRKYGEQPLSSAASGAQTKAVFF